MDFPSFPLMYTMETINFPQCNFLVIHNGFSYYSEWEEHISHDVIILKPIMVFLSFPLMESVNYPSMGRIPFSH